MPKKHRIIVLLGPTACGKTAFGVQLALRLHASIISADSRQIYRGLDLGTGKDLQDYDLPDGGHIPYELIDILPPDAPYSLAHFLRDAAEAVCRVEENGRVPLFVGGTALYLHGLVSAYQLKHGAPDDEMREHLRSLSNEDLCTMLLELDPASPVPVREPDNRIRLIRAIEMARSKNDTHTTELEEQFPPSEFLILGLYRTRSEIRERIRIRLEQRLNAGMIDEVAVLHEQGMSWERMEFLGLEYRYLSRCLRGVLTLKEMKNELYAKICQFAKRQDSWFRRFERDGHPVYWFEPGQIDGAEMLCRDFLAGQTLPEPVFRLAECKYPVHP